MSPGRGATSRRSVSSTTFVRSEHGCCEGQAGLLSWILMRHDLGLKKLLTPAGRFVAWLPAWHVLIPRRLRCLPGGTVVVRQTPVSLAPRETPSRCRSVGAQTCAG